MTSWLESIVTCDAIRRDKPCGRQHRIEFPAKDPSTTHDKRGWVRIDLLHAKGRGTAEDDHQEPFLVDLCPICAMALGYTTYEKAVPGPPSDQLKRDWEEEVLRVISLDKIRLPDPRG